MGKTIVVPLDGSHFSRTALPYACVLARAVGASLLLVRAVDEGVTAPGEDASAESALSVDARGELGALADGLGTDGCAVAWRVVQGGAAATILEAARAD